MEQLHLNRRLEDYLEMRQLPNPRVEAFSVQHQQQHNSRVGVYLGVPNLSNKLVNRKVVAALKVNHNKEQYHRRQDQRPFQGLLRLLYRMQTLCFRQ